jgi:hypothetical protein
MVASRRKAGLTPAQRKWLIRARDNRLGVVECPWTGGLARSTWHRMMERMVKEHLVTPYVHGGYEITSYGIGVLWDINSPPKAQL